MHLIILSYCVRAVWFFLVLFVIGWAFSIKNADAIDISVPEPICSILCPYPPPGCHYEGTIASGRCSEVTCGTVVCGAPPSCHAGDVRTRACQVGRAGGIRRDTCEGGEWVYGECNTRPSSKCGPGELLCARTGECYKKGNPSLCRECNGDSECGPSAMCRNHRCYRY